ncbi:hypothetical protein K435DRAFT_865621 [Dendrothele bispora CBS 962.96]|uniref:Uncharacterized protein n=1 Tax=Dendrothele bispora (strain CBS 962.96) TaxID=1314807 RepID=A0A4S8LKE6_DENBC|nr:hypothetical protein K435DRAFT_865621 [Dendrothele bispora CBS 962.96]
MAVTLKWALEKSVVNITVISGNSKNPAGATAVGAPPGMSGLAGSVDGSLVGATALADPPHGVPFVLLLVIAVVVVEHGESVGMDLVEPNRGFGVLLWQVGEGSLVMLLLRLLSIYPETLDSDEAVAGCASADFEGIEEDR